MASKGLIIVVVSSLVCLVLTEETHSKTDKSEFKKSLGKNCDKSYSLTCFKLDTVSFVDKLSANDNISVLPGVSLVREKNSGKTDNDGIVADLAREFPDDPNGRLDSLILKKIVGFLDNHSIKLNLWKAVQASTDGTARKSGGGGGGGGGKKGGGGGGGMGMVLAMGAMMKGMMMSMALAGVAAIAGKALMASLAALLLAALASLKGHGGGGGGHTTYEVVSKPIYSSSHSQSSSHEGGGWDGYGHGRSLDNYPLPIALQPEYQPPQ